MPKYPLLARSTQVQPAPALLQAPLDLGDALFSGEPIPRPVTPRTWRSEGGVHGARELSRAQATTRPFLGGQVQLVRDELRGRTWAGVLEADGGRLVCLDGDGTEARRFGSGAVERLHLALDKHSGRVHLAWTEAGPARSLWLDGARVDVGDDDPDFPFLAWSQPPIGHRCPSPPPFGLLAWRDRKSGVARVRRLLPGGRGSTTITVGHFPILGGPRLAIHGDEALLVLHTLTKDRLSLALLRSRSGGEDFEPGAEQIDAEAWGEGWRLAPALAPPVVDHLGFFHVPFLVRRGRELIAVNLIPDEALVEAIHTEAESRASLVLAAFPKKGATGNARGEDRRFGDGTTDGLGLIMVVQADGRLLASNSQAGGRHFPEPAVLNHEMPDLAAFAATECYTAGRTPNTVSMDYLWIEGDARGAPVSPVLHAETWDMPLPEPVVTAWWNDHHAHLIIEKDANFLEGQTTFTVDDPRIEISRARLEGPRRAVLTFSTADLRGRRVSFEAKSAFYHHRGQVVIGGAG